MRLCVYLFALQHQNYLADFNETFYKWFPVDQLSAFEFQLINIIDDVTAAVFKKKRKNYHDYSFYQIFLKFGM